MKRVYLIIAVLVATGIVAAALGLRRVPAGYEAVRTLDGGSFTVLDAGWHFVGPGKHLIRYPIGRREYRVPDPATGQSFPVLFQNGESVLVAFDAAIDIPAGSARTLYEQFSANFDEGVERLVVAAAENQAAADAVPPDAGAFTSGVRTRIKEQLAPFGLTLSELRAVRFGDRTFEAAATDDAVGPARRLVIVGVDGGDWLNLRPLIDAGKLPNFARLVKDGATGPLRSEEPMLSPLLWTTMATGRYPEQHGILNFTVTDPRTGVRVPISRLYRRVDAFWNMLGDYNRSVAIIGWLATDPAEAVDGLMVTDKFGYLAYAPADTTRAEVTSIYPPSRDDELSRLVVHGESVPAADILRFVDLTPEELAKHRGEFDPKDPVNALIHLYASTMSFRNIALHELETEKPDVLAVYFEWVDAMSHLFMLQTPPRMPDVPENEYRAYHGAVEQAYITQDNILGDIMDAMGDDAVLMVLSDHGFKSGESRLHNRPEIWAGNAAKWHRLDGIVGFYGKGVKPGYTIEGASIMDVTPTVLALMGLPRAQDMPGKPLADAFQKEVAGAFSDQSVATLDKPRAQAGQPEPGTASEETMKKLEALGYLAPDNADAQNNLGQRYQQKGEYRKAVEAYQEAIRMRPNFYAAYNNLAVCFGKLQMYDQAEAALERCIALKPDDFYAMNNLAVMYLQTGRVEEGTRYAEQSVKTEPGYANGRVTLGSVYAMQRRYDDAEKQFREALRLDPENEAARTNLDKLAAARKAQ